MPALSGGQHLFLFLFSPASFSSLPSFSRLCCTFLLIPLPFLSPPFMFHFKTHLRMRGGWGGGGVSLSSTCSIHQSPFSALKCKTPFFFGSPLWSPTQLACFVFLISPRLDLCSLVFLLGGEAPLLKIMYLIVLDNMFVCFQSRPCTFVLPI